MFFTGSFPRQLGSLVFIEDCRFVRNIVQSQIASAQGGACVFDIPKVSISSSHFLNNSAQQGGALSASSNTFLELRKVTFRDNVASNGGAIHSYGCEIMMLILVSACFPLSLFFSFDCICISVGTYSNYF